MSPAETAELKEAQTKAMFARLLEFTDRSLAADQARALVATLTAEAEVKRRQEEAEAAEAARQEAVGQAERQEAARAAAAKATLKSLGELQAEATAAFAKATAVLAKLQGRRKGHADELEALRQK